MQTKIIVVVLSLAALAYCHGSFNPQYPQHIPSQNTLGNAWGGHSSFPSWNRPGQWNPYQNCQPGHHGHHGHHGHGHNNFGFNFADKYAMDYFNRNGYSVQSAIHFCNGHRHSHIINYSQYLKSYCRKIRQSYGGGAIPTYPKVSTNPQNGF
uniref:Conserved secreted protein n=1 Tax=Rhabditophanes sp. KR3021 TaxID=114890 RepID=A0AC35U0G2_9BILA